MKRLIEYELVVAIVAIIATVSLCSIVCESDERQSLTAACVVAFIGIGLSIVGCDDRGQDTSNKVAAGFTGILGSALIPISIYGNVAVEIIVIAVFIVFIFSVAWIIFSAFNADKASDVISTLSFLAMTLVNFGILYYIPRLV